MKFEYTAPAPGALSGKPLVQIALYSAGHEICVSALVDSGAAISILPYDMGLQLGFVWEEQTMPVRLGGMLAGVPAVAVLVRGEVSALFPTALGDGLGQRDSAHDTASVGATKFFPTV